MMHRESTLALAACAALVFCLAPSPRSFAQDNSKEAKKPSASESGAAEQADVEEEDGGLQAARFMPLNKPNLRVKIPQFKDGELECVMNAAEMVRISEEDIDIKKMKMEFLERGEVTTKIELSDARYSLEDRLLSTQNRAVIQREDFTLVGDTMEFDTVEQRGKMVGKVRMVIHDSSGFRKQGEEEEEVKPEAEAGLSIAEAARLIARVAAYQKELTKGDPAAE